MTISLFSVYKVFRVVKRYLICVDNQEYFPRAKHPLIPIICFV